MESEPRGGRTDRLVLRITPGEKARLRKEADSVGLDISEYVRGRLFGASPTIHAAATYASLQPQTLSDINTRLSNIEQAITQGRSVLTGEKE